MRQYVPRNKTRFFDQKREVLTEHLHGAQACVRGMERATKSQRTDEGLAVPDDDVANAFHGPGSERGKQHDGGTSELGSGIVVLGESACP